MAALQAQRASIDAKVAEAAHQGKVLMLNEVHARMVGHIRTGNMNDGFDRASTVEKVDEAHYRITIQTDATNNGFPYPNVVEARYGMISSGCHAAMPAVAENLKKKLEG